MVIVHQGRYGRYVEGTITITIRAELKADDKRNEIPNTEALLLLERAQEELAGSNDGSEKIANAKIIY